MSFVEQLVKVLKIQDSRFKDSNIKDLRADLKSGSIEFTNFLSSSSSLKYLTEKISLLQGQKFVAVGAESRYLAFTATNRDI